MQPDGTAALLYARPHEKIGYLLAKFQAATPEAPP